MAGRHEQGSEVAGVSGVDALVRATRLSPPAATGGYVSRPRLLRLLGPVHGTSLVLVSAPAGTGKTSLVAEWLRAAAPGRRTDGSVGWLSFDDGDEDVWPLLLTALAELGVPVPPAAESAGSTIAPSALAATAEALAGRPTPVTLVLDGFESASGTVASGLDHLLRRSGGSLQLVVVTRIDPVLPLYRYHLDDTVAEVRAADLALTDEEADQVLRAAGVSLPAADVHALNDRVHGWVTGLRFAARTLSGRRDVPSAAERVVAETGDIGEYLVTEVLDGQPDDVRRLLLDTCVVDTLHPGLSEALAGPAATATLAALTRGNAFVESLAGRPGCYRYPPFFRDFLRAVLAHEDPARHAEQHRRAAAWHRRRGLLPAAVHHLAAAGDWAQAAGAAVDGEAIADVLLDEDNALTRTFDGLPADVDSPAAHVVRAARAMAVGEVARCDAELRRLDGPDNESRTGTPARSAATATVEAVLARSTAEPELARKLADEAERTIRRLGLRHPVPGRARLAVVAQTSRGLARLRLGDVAGAREAFVTGATIAATDSPAYASVLAECLGYLAVGNVLDGRLDRAERAARHATATAERYGVPPGHRGPAASLALADVALQHGDLAAARDRLREARHCGSRSAEPVAATLDAIVAAGLQRRQGQEDDARATASAAASRLGPADDWLRSLVLHIGPEPGVASPLVEPLTAKELEVLGHLAGLLSTDEIAETMYVSKNTVRTHVRNILRKLGVSRRNVAVRRARELHLLGR